MALKSLLHRLLMFATIALVTLAIGSAGGGEESFDFSKAVVGVNAVVPDTARTARILGTERIGSGIVIDGTGLILTIGYLILEADNAIVTGPGGKQAPATIIAYDHDSGFGLLRVRGSLDTTPMRLGESRNLTQGNAVVIASRGGDHQVMATRVVSRRVFTGGWEYMLESAIFTAPPHSFHSGAALIGEDGRLLGVGSLLVSDAAGPGRHMPGNMFVPVELLKPVLGNLLEQGRRAGKARPWIGANTAEIAGRLVVTGVLQSGPAAKAGIADGDLIVGVAGKPISGQADFYRQVWNYGPAGVVVPLNTLPKDLTEMKIKEVLIRSIDRSNWLRLRRSY